jgi:hypothetical protein
MSKDADQLVQAPTTAAQHGLAAPLQELPVKRTALATVTQGVRAVVPYADYAAQRLGKLGIVGVALCVFSAVVLVSTNSPLRQQLQSDTQTLEQFASQTDGTSAIAIPTTPQAQYEAFLNGLPTRDDLPMLMGQVVTASVSTGVALEEGHYELVAAGKAGQIARYRLGFPVVGSYPQVRGFIDKALVAVPEMSLDGVTLQRSEVGEGVVNAELDFAVFVRTGT